MAQQPAINASREVFAQSLAKQAGNWFGFHQFARLVQVVVNQGVRSNTKRVVDRCQQLHGMDRIS
jgi:hypothetical protein